jgi:hypothetical protein
LQMDLSNQTPRWSSSTVRTASTLCVLSPFLTPFLPPPLSITGKLALPIQPFLLHHLCTAYPPYLIHLVASALFSVTYPPLYHLIRVFAPSLPPLPVQVESYCLKVYFQGCTNCNVTFNAKILTGTLETYGVLFPAEIYTRGSHWIPRMFA